MLKNKHLRIDQKKIEMAKKILQAKTDTEALDRALDKVIRLDQERIKKRMLLKRLLQLRSKIGPVKEDSTHWIQIARQERATAFHDRSR